ncbi:hypothetical protein FUAX_53090 (plasmid) [Fulvitalea axinellae]|uniref:Uncharacterized protein n=1 Tax=Fulvitalea axinellae TaxID=1182444 RepID=A0AAU9D676_9BACT|nr:hypothetical protein FUAX_53090 [Fulvitalea axinellae]
MKKSLLTICLIFSLQKLVAQEITPVKTIEFLNTVGGHGGDSTFLRRYDSGGDITDLRLQLGDEYTSHFRIGYIRYQDGQWKSVFHLQGTGDLWLKRNLTMDGNLGVGTLTPSSKLSVLGGISKLTKTGVDGTWDNLIKYGHKSDLESSGTNINRWHGIDATITAGPAENNKMKFRLYPGSSSNPAPIDVMTLVGDGNVGIGTAEQILARLQIASGSQNWGEEKQGKTPGTIHLDPNKVVTDYGNAITFGATNHRGFDQAQAGIYVRSGDLYGTRMYFSTTDNYSQGPKTAMMLDHEGNIGMGIVLPKAKLHVKSPGASKGFKDKYVTSLIEGEDARLQIISANEGNNGSALILSNENSSWGFHQKTDKHQNRLDIGFNQATEIEDNANDQTVSMSFFNNGNIGIGTFTTGPHRLAVEGSIGARAIKVQASGWADFVFDDNYKLPSLSEVEKHIRTHGHLQDVPTAEQVKTEGVDLGAMNTKLLQKIEELTLYAIQQEKKIKALEKQNAELQELKTLVRQLIQEKK